MLAVLYIVNPREVQIGVADVIPTEVEAVFGAAVPDTVYITTELPEGIPMPSREADSVFTKKFSDGIFVSEKTFRKQLLLGSVKSNVKAYAPAAVYGFENTVSFRPNKQAMMEELNEEIGRKCKASFWKGTYVGAGAMAAGIAVAVIVLK